MQQVLLIFTFCTVFLREGTSLLPLFQEAKQRASQSSNSFAALKIMHWLAHVSRLTGQLQWVYQEGKDTQASPTQRVCSL